MTPVSPVFVLGVELAMYVVYCLVSLATLAAAALLWGMRLRGLLPAFLGSWALTVLSTLSVGLLVGGVAKDTRQASVIASTLYFPMLLFSGTTLPLEVMPKAMQTVVGVFPLTQGIAMMKHAFLGIGLGSVLPPICVMLALTALCNRITYNQNIHIKTIRQLLIEAVFRLFPLQRLCLCLIFCGNLFVQLCQFFVPCIGFSLFTPHQDANYCDHNDNQNDLRFVPISAAVFPIQFTTHFAFSFSCSSPITGAPSSASK